MLLTPSSAHSTIKPDLSPQQGLDDFITRWFEEIEEEQGARKKVLRQFDLCELPEFFSAFGLPVISNDSVQHPMVVLHLPLKIDSLATKKAKTVLHITYFSLRPHKAQGGPSTTPN